MITRSEYYQIRNISFAKHEQQQIPSYAISQIQSKAGTSRTIKHITFELLSPRFQSVQVHWNRVQWKFD